jgi:hypothetical protein
MEPTSSDVRDAFVQTLARPGVAVPLVRGSGHGARHEVDPPDCTLKRSPDALGGRPRARGCVRLARAGDTEHVRRLTGDSDQVPLARQRAALALGEALLAESEARDLLLAQIRAHRQARADVPVPVSLVRAAELFQVACHEVRMAQTRLEVAPPSIPPPA